MQLVDLRNTYGNFSNHLYFSLMMYMLGRQYNDGFKYIRGDDFIKFNLERRLSRIGCNVFSAWPGEIAGQHVHCNIQHPTKRYHQLFNVDFTLDQVESFIQDVILKSELYNDRISTCKDICGIHVRCGDYQNSQYDCFDKVKYLEKAFALVPAEIVSVRIFSDDMDYVRSSFDKLLSSRFKDVQYSANASSEEDFRDFSLIRHKVLWNSTFSYWCGFIGNAIYEDSYDNVVAPCKFDRNEPVCNHVNPMWKVINV